MSKPRARRRARGAALLTVTLVLFLLMLGLGLVDGALLARLRAAREEAQRVELQALADAAMAEALAHLASDPGHPGVARHGFARGAISSRIEADGAGRYRVAARAELGTRRLAIRADVVMAWGRPVVQAWRLDTATAAR